MKVFKTITNSNIFTLLSVVEDTVTLEAFKEKSMENSFMGLEVVDVVEVTEATHYQVTSEVVESSVLADKKNWN